MWLVCIAAFGLYAPESQAARPSFLEAVTFWEQREEIFVPIERICKLLRWRIGRNSQGDCTLNNAPLAEPDLRQLTDGTELVSLSGLQSAGATIQLEPPQLTWSIEYRGRKIEVRTGSKRVEINLRTQTLHAWQGDLLVLQCRISSGRNNSTPVGAFSAGPFRARMHYSSRYHRAPMPWSVQIRGHVFVHGFSEVPTYPASHGCIRLPLDEGNPAKFFYEWVDDGTPVVVRRL